MPSTDNSFSAPFGTIERVLRALSKSGIDPKAFCQRIIDDPDFCKEVAYLMDPSLRPVPQPEYPVFKGEVDLDQLRRMFTALLGRHADDDPRVIRFCTAEGLHEISHGVTQRDFDIIADRFGLGGADFRSRRWLADLHEISETRIKQIENSALSLMRANMKQIMEDNVFLKLPITERPIDVLGLSERSYNCLKRAEIHTVGRLALTSDAHLLNITNFTQKCLEEVKQKLAEYAPTLQ